MPLLRLDRKNGKPLYQQMIEQIRKMVESDILKKGDPLPTTREMAKRLGVDLPSSSLIQSALWAFIRNGYFDRHLKWRHRMFWRRLTVAFSALVENMPATVSWTRPDGEYTIWVNLKNSYQDEQLLKKIKIRKGVLLSPGASYFHISNVQKYFRISISTLNEEKIKNGISRLRKALQEVLWLRKSL